MAFLFILEKILKTDFGHHRCLITSFFQVKMPMTWPIFSDFVMKYAKPQWQKIGPKLGREGTGGTRGGDAGRKAPIWRGRP